MRTLSCWLSVFYCLVLIDISDAVKCGTCVDGKAAHNKNLFESFRVPRKGEYPRCSGHGKAVSIPYIDCETSCLAAEIANGNIVIAMARFCSDGMFFDNGTYRTDHVFKTVPAGNLANYFIRSRVCSTDFCNMDKLPANWKPTTPHTPYFRFERMTTDASSSLSLLLTICMILLL